MPDNKPYVVIDEIRSEQKLWWEVYVVYGEEIVSDTDEVFGTVDAALAYANKLVKRWLME